eukprot:Protomagalhaensia_wolfi_Nauph_80__4457@NODE_456_length_2486_cov_15_266040_g342_i0_p2_GENE_NODE_456_length_2486_cov_15_266040_g342_i0NODE_456_length_2486_cov_15_266040_g342_i0_p2_ORF_typecomplete_len308_score29_23_NODE_456_length_2486_cov_15_266040_g342_i013822305
MVRHLASGSFSGEMCKTLLLGHAVCIASRFINIVDLASIQEVKICDIRYAASQSTGWIIFNSQDDFSYAAVLYEPDSQIACILESPPMPDKEALLKSQDRLVNHLSVKEPGFFRIGDQRINVLKGFNREFVDLKNVPLATLEPSYGSAAYLYHLVSFIHASGTDQLDLQWGSLQDNRFSWEVQEMAEVTVMVSKTTNCSPGCPAEDMLSHLLRRLRDLKSSLTPHSMAFIKVEDKWTLVSYDVSHALSIPVDIDSPESWDTDKQVRTQIVLRALADAMHSQVYLTQNSREVSINPSVGQQEQQVVTS